MAGDEELPNYYEVLGVDKKATDAQLKKAYKKLALKLHPDKNRDNPNCEHDFAVLNEAYATLSHPVKRIDYNKKIAKDDAGWGWNANKARQNAGNYEWDAGGRGTDMFFSRGGHMHASERPARACACIPLPGGEGRLWETCSEVSAPFYLAVVASSAVTQALMIQTALSLGVHRSLAIWAPILIAVACVGGMLSPRTSDYSFAAGNLCLVSPVLSLCTGLIASDIFVAARHMRSSQGWDVDASLSQLPRNDFTLIGWRDGTRVDIDRVVADPGGACAAPITAAAERGTPYSLDAVGYWAVAEGCCSGGAVSCRGWGEAWGGGLQWRRPDRPSALFLARPPPWAAPGAAGGALAAGGVAVEWVEDPGGEVWGRLEAAGYALVAAPLLMWPLAVGAAWLAGSLGACALVRGLSCGRRPDRWLLFACGGFRGCWDDAPGWCFGGGGGFGEDDDDPE